MNLESLLKVIISDNRLHAYWLNTLSYLENCGARKIAACEHPTLVKEEMLKHAAEEFRHAYYLKKQIEKVYPDHLSDYSLINILGQEASRNYLSRLDLHICRYLKAILPRKLLKPAAYLLVTYAIEVRAGELYPLYASLLRQAGSKVAVNSIVLEEKEHLKEMEEGIKQMVDGEIYAKKALSIENRLYQNWLKAITSTSQLKRNGLFTSSISSFNKDALAKRISSIFRNP